MSRNHSVLANEAAHLAKEVESLDPEDARMIHGVEINEDKSVYDPMFGMNFDSVREWAEFTVEQDELQYSEAFAGGKEGFDDLM